MNKTCLMEFNNLINEEITSYTDLKTLYEKKKSVLVSHKIDELFIVDTDISEKLKHLKKLAKQREEIAKQSNIKNINLSLLIEKANCVDSILAENFVAQKTTLQKLAKEIKNLEETNLALTKQGLEISSKIINKIFKEANNVSNRSFACS